MPRGHGLLLRAPQMSDFVQWAQLRESSRAYPARVRSSDGQIGSHGVR